jgi:hypothetical protein
MDVSSAEPPQSGPAGGLARVLTTIPVDVLREVAQQLGIGVGQLRAEIAAGKPLSDLAAISHAAQSVPLVDEPHGDVVDVHL